MKMAVTAMHSHSQSVVLVLSHDASGSTGVILNRPIGKLAGDKKKSPYGTEASPSRVTTGTSHIFWTSSGPHLLQLAPESP